MGWREKPVSQAAVAEQMKTETEYRNAVVVGMNYSAVAAAADDE